MYANDLPRCVSDSMIKYADDVKKCHYISTDNDLDDLYLIVPKKKQMVKFPESSVICHLTYPTILIEFSTYLVLINHLHIWFFSSKISSFWTPSGLSNLRFLVVTGDDRPYSQIRATIFPSRTIQTVPRLVKFYFRPCFSVHFISYTPFSILGSFLDY